MLVLGIGAHWLAWRARIPSILTLLAIGLLVGPGWSALTGAKLLDPDALFGGLLLPCASLSVGVILFEGGLSLRRSELKDVGHVVRNLCTIGVVVTWGLVTLLAWGLGLLSPALALLLGAILTVTGPTVIGPLLQHVRLRGPAATVLRWESIVVDPIGATLALLVFEVAQATTLDHGAVAAALTLLKTIAAGGAMGAVGGALLVESIRRHDWCPDHLENPATLMVVVATYAASDFIQAESGLLAVTVLGVQLANRLREQELRHIVEFKENLKVVLLSALFIVLAARLGPADLGAALGWRSLVFVLALVLVVRPLCVLASTAGSRLTGVERAYLAVMAPRGIVACAVSTVFALRFVELGHAEAMALPSVTILVIVATVSICGLLAAPLARRTGLADPDPQGLLILGAHAWARDMALVLQREGVEVLLLDSNEANSAQARAAGLKALHVNVLSEYVLSELDLGAMGRLLAVTPNDAVNALATDRLAHLLGRGNVFQLAPRQESKVHDPTHHHRVRYLFGAEETFARISERFEDGAVLLATRIGPEFPYAAWQAAYAGSGLPLFVISRRRVHVFATDRAPAPANGDVVVSLVMPRSDSTVSGRVLAQPPPDAPAPHAAEAPPEG